MSNEVSWALFVFQIMMFVYGLVMHVFSLAKYNEMNRGSVLVLLIGTFFAPYNLWMALT